MKKILVLTILGMFFWGGCSKDASTAPYTPTCSGTAKSFKNDVAPIIQSSCNGCHAGLSSYNSLYTSRGAVRNAIVSGSMPRGGSLSTSQKDAIVCWIDNGATNN
jgi:hypothetical protein